MGFSKKKNEKFCWPKKCPLILMEKFSDTLLMIVEEKKIRLPIVPPVFVTQVNWFLCITGLHFLIRFARFPKSQPIIFFLIFVYMFCSNLLKRIQKKCHKNRSNKKFRRRIFPNTFFLKCWNTFFFLETYFFNLNIKKNLFWGGAKPKSILRGGSGIVNVEEPFADPPPLFTSKKTDILFLFLITSHCNLKTKFR